MKILLDECLPVKFKNEFNEFTTYTVRDKSWIGVKNGELLKKARDDHFDVFVTSDKKLRYQINRDELKIAIIIIDTMRNDILSLREITQKIKEALNQIKSPDVVIVNKFGVSK
jgi:predicted nuclease of predicted toxin-antitoxin system